MVETATETKIVKHNIITSLKSFYDNDRLKTVWLIDGTVISNIDKLKDLGDALAIHGTVRAKELFLVINPNHITAISYE